MFTIDLANLDGASGFSIQGVDAQDLSGFSVAGVGDFNGWSAPTEWSGCNVSAWTVSALEA